MGPLDHESTALQLAAHSSPTLGMLPGHDLQHREGHGDQRGRIQRLECGLLMNDSDYQTQNKDTNPINPCGLLKSIFMLPSGYLT